MLAARLCSLLAELRHGPRRTQHIALLVELLQVGLICWLAAACSDARKAPVNPRDASTPIDATVGVDATADAAADAAFGFERCPAPAATSPLSALEVEVPSSLPPGSPFMISVRSTPAIDTLVQVCISDQPLAQVQLYRGRGSVSTTLSEEQSVVLQLAAKGARLERMLRVEARPKNAVSGMLDTNETTWSSEQDHVITGRAVVPRGAQLRIEAGARVLLEERASLEIQGELSVRGSAEEPVLFTRAGEAAWGELRFAKDANIQLDHTWLTASVGDPSHMIGHSMSSPVISMVDATLTMRGGGLFDNPGKAFGTERGGVTLEDVLVTRCDTGGEFINTKLHVRRGHVLEMPDADGSRDDDDNDGIYVLGEAQDAEGKPLQSVIEDSVFARGEDDGIDHNASLLRVERVWIEGFAHECVAGSMSSELRVVDSVLRDCEQGIEAGYGAPRVLVEHSLITGNQVGVRYGDTYDKTSNGSLEVTDSIISGNVLATKNFVGSLDGPRPDKLQIRCSIIDDADFSQRDGNRTPEAGWQDGSCVGQQAPRDESAADSCDPSGPGTHSCF